MERLQKVIANLGYTSRRNAEKLILEGKVTVNGNIVNTTLNVEITLPDINNPKTNNTNNKKEIELFKS